MEKRLPVALRAVARLKSAKKGRRELMVASALAFGETRRIKRTETRRDSGVIVIIALVLSLLAQFSLILRKTLCVSVLGESNKCEKGTLDARQGKKHSTLPKFFILHSSFIIMHRLRILISFCAYTLADEF